jgi:hypothetical protein
MTVPGPTRYALGMLEGSMGLVAGSLREELVPRDLVADLCSAMRGSHPTDDTTPSLEVRIKQLLDKVERDSLDSHGYFVRKARWPRAAKFAVCLTHDIDNIERPREHVVRVKDRFSKGDYEKWERGELSLYDNIDMIASKESGCGFHSSFYYMSAEYPLEGLKKVAGKLERRGWDLGLHGDFGTHDSYANMRKATERLRKGLGISPIGVREHYLKFDFARSWNIMDRAGFDYDTTVGNNDRLGFKLGLATPFHPPDGKWRPLRLLELPLSLMDTTLWGYLKKTEEEGLNDVIRFMDMVEGVECLFTLLWHQEAVRMKGGRIYWLILRQLQESGAFVGSGAEVSRWWRAREVPLKVSKDGKKIQLAGPAPEGLVLQLKVEAGSKVKLPPSVSRKVKGKTHEHEIVPKGPSFALELSSR